MCNCVSLVHSLVSRLLMIRYNKFLLLPVHIPNRYIAVISNRNYKNNE